MIFLYLLLLIALVVIAIFVNDEFDYELNEHVEKKYWNPFNIWKEIDSLENARYLVKFVLKFLGTALFWSITNGIYILSFRWSRSIFLKN